MQVYMRLATGFLLLAGLLLLPIQALYADEFSKRRADVGLKLFRTFVSADLDIQSKAKNGEVLVILTYANDERIAKDHQSKLQAAFTKVNNLPVVIRTVNLEQVLSSKLIQPAALFVSQPLTSQERDALVLYAIKNSIIIFSPYEGDVEQGILAGISVQARIRPFINMETIKKGKFNIKPFYLKVAKQHE